MEPLLSTLESKVKAACGVCVCSKRVTKLCMQTTGGESRGCQWLQVRVKASVDERATGINHRHRHRHKQRHRHRHGLGHRHRHRYRHMINTLSVTHTATETETDKDTARDTETDADTDTDTDRQTDRLTGRQVDPVIQEHGVQKGSGQRLYLHLCVGVWERISRTT